MSDAVHNVQQEFWRPPLSQPTATTNLAEACRRCGTEFMVGAAFCHICGANRHRANVSRPSLLLPASWAKYLDFVRELEITSSLKIWFGLPLPALCAFFLGVIFFMVAVGVGFTGGLNGDMDFQAIHYWRIEWLVAACASFLAGILLRKS
ncbi:MAG: hypothetical protein J2P13_08625 [Acidobacteria bacterium]|nr:hypothetical protein [Acidobacteriota bacterium]